MTDLSSSVWDLPVVVIDTETTGLPPDGRCVEIAAVRYERGLPVARFSSLIFPGCPIPAEATAIHGIKDDDVLRKPRLAEVSGDLMRVCNGAVPCAYSANFDRAILHAEIQGDDCMTFDPEQAWIDVLVLVKHFDRWAKGKGRHRLTSTCARHGIALEGAHRAEADAIATGALLWSFKGKVGDMSAEKLIAAICKRRAEQEADFARWRASQSKKEAAE